MYQGDFLLANEPIGSAVISECGRYRYTLTRKLKGSGPTAVFVMLNPSTADSSQDDPTIRRCMGFASRWNCRQLVVLNLFAMRATDPAEMKRAADPVGPDNREWFRHVLTTYSVSPLICAWGVHGTHRGQDRVVRGWLKEFGCEPFVLGLTKDGHPKHPLYLPGDSEASPWPL